MIWFIIFKAVMIGLLLGALLMFLSLSNKRESNLGTSELPLLTQLSTSSFASKLLLWIRFFCKVIICLVFFVVALLLLKLILI